jgi:hypothetical protein
MHSKSSNNKSRFSIFQNDQLSPAYIAYLQSIKAGQGKKTGDSENTSEETTSRVTPGFNGAFGNLI